jgi:hypothetical protein
MRGNEAKENPVIKTMERFCLPLRSARCSLLRERARLRHVVVKGREGFVTTNRRLRGSLHVASVKSNRTKINMKRFEGFLEYLTV